MMSNTAMHRARDIILECLMVRQGVVLTPMVCRERANNCAQALMELLEPRGNVASGEIETPDTAIGVVRAPEHSEGE